MPASAAASRAPASATAPSIAGTSLIRVLEGGRARSPDRLHRNGPGRCSPTVRQAVCEETGLPPEIMTVRWDKELGAKCGETWASRATTLSCAAAQRAAAKLAADLKQSPLEQLAGREYHGRLRLQLHHQAGHSRSATEPDHALDLQLRHAGGDSRRRRPARARRCGARRRPRHQSQGLRGTDRRRRPHGPRLCALGEFPSHRRRPDSLLLRDLRHPQGQRHAQG